MLEYDFMKNALLATIIVTPLFGILGTMIVNNKLAFFSDALGHSAFTGIALGVLLGIANSTFSMITYAVVFALILNLIKRKNVMSTDTIISVFASFSTALGLVILSKGGNFGKFAGLLIGDILSITTKEILQLLCVFLVTIIFWILGFNKLNAISVNRSLAKSKNISVTLIDNIFSLIIAFIVMLSVKWVGILIINALLIIPAASSRNISSNIREYHIYSIIFSLFSGICGLIYSYYHNVATGPTIVIIAGVIFFITLIFKDKLR